MGRKLGQQLVSFGLNDEMNVKGSVRPQTDVNLSGCAKLRHHLSNPAKQWAELARLGA